MRSEGPASAAAAAGLQDIPPTAIPQTAHDAITAPAKLPFQPLPAPAATQAMPDLPPVSASTTPITEPPRPKAPTMVPTPDELDGGWDIGDDDPTATSDDAQAAAAADAAMERPDPQTPPSSSDMAGDGSSGADGIDEPGWD
jgi:hypothetical protein